jgi:hypothetical protein
MMMAPKKDDERLMAFLLKRFSLNALIAAHDRAKVDAPDHPDTHLLNRVVDEKQIIRRPVAKDAA